MKNYNLFIPPEQISLPNHREWSRKEADEYKDWLISVLDERIDFLLDYLSDSETGSVALPEKKNVEEFLRLIGRKVVSKLREPSFSEEDDALGKKVLTNNGYALAADAGLLVAKLLLMYCGDNIRWHVIRGHKREISYNLPVLIGNKNGYNFFEPIGASIAEAQAVLRGEEEGNAWKKIYTFMCSVV